MTIRGKTQRLVPSSLINWLRRKRKAWQGASRLRMREKLIAQHRTFSAANLVAFCRDSGIHENGILFVQCSYNDLVTYSGSPYELLSGLQELVGPRGTLMLPAFSSNMLERTQCRPFDVRTEPTYAGIIAELFRREEGVVRSLHPRHSLCAIGPDAAKLLEGHEDCMYADGASSPFERIRALNGTALCLGMKPGFNSFIHWIEDIEPEKFPGKVHEGPYDWVLRNAKGEEIRRLFYRRSSKPHDDPPYIGRHLGPNAVRHLKFHGVSLCIYPLQALSRELVALRDRGITLTRGR